MKDANCAWVLPSPPSLLKLLKKNMHVVHHTWSQRSRSYGYFTKQNFITPPILHVLYFHCFAIGFWKYLQPALMLEPLECHNLTFTACTTHINIYPLNQFVPKADVEVIYPPLKVAKRKTGINRRPITELAKPCLTGTNTWQGPGFFTMH